jgi:hypothetical protein
MSCVRAETAKPSSTEHNIIQAVCSVSVVHRGWRLPVHELDKLGERVPVRDRNGEHVWRRIHLNAGLVKLITAFASTHKAERVVRRAAALFRTASPGYDIPTHQKDWIHFLAWHYHEGSPAAFIGGPRFSYRTTALHLWLCAELSLFKLSSAEFRYPSQRVRDRGRAFLMSYLQPRLTRHSQEDVGTENGRIRLIPHMGAAGLMSSDITIYDDVDLVGTPQLQKSIAIANTFVCGTYLWLSPSRTVHC